MTIQSAGSNWTVPWSRLLCASMLIGAFVTPLVPAQAPPLNVLLITIDTLRADRLGSYGYAAARTPNLDRLATSGVRFADATAHAPLTHPSHAAIMTGRYPGAFGIRLNGMDPLPDEAATLAERLQGAGYRTGAIVASVIVDRSSGLAQGFDHYDDAITGPVSQMMAMADLQRRADDVTTRAADWIRQQRGPWFLWAHYYDPHLPYDAPAAHARSAPGQPYDAEVAHVDAEIGRLLASVDRASTIVVVTSDHGEALGEHGEPDHGYFLYDATLHVPLIITGPGVPARTVTEQVRSIDIAPTIAQLARVDWPADRTGGEGLRTLIDGGRRAEVPVSIAESWYPRLHFGWSELRSARVGEWKFVAAPRPELYDLRVDPGESKNLATTRGSVAGRLAADLQEVLASFSKRPAETAAQPDAETVRRLQALGYVGAFAPVTAEGAAEDPKDHVEEYRAYRERFNRALGLLGRRQPAQAATILRQLVKSNVRAFEAHLYLGNAYFMQERHEDALAEYDVASQLNPSLSTPHFEAAKALAATGEFEQATARAKQGLALDPGSFYGHYTLGVVHQRAGQWTEAFVAFSRAVELNGDDPRARANLAGAAMRTGNLAVAQLQFEAMIELKHQVAPAQFNLGVIAARRGQTAEAARRYRLALEADPAFKPARDALARIK